MQDATTANTAKTSRSVKWRLISLIQVELGSKHNPSIRKTADKIISELNMADENYEALQKPMKKAIKMIRLTIDNDLANVIQNNSNKLLEQIKQ
ncbi:MAG: hypothetical protein PVH46_09050 [Granulosicoccaceae bacterium]|jgi:hypothetical protein